MQVQFKDIANVLICRLFILVFYRIHFFNCHLKLEQALENFQLLY